jgi:putative hydrolase of the HAD superfamily
MRWKAVIFDFFGTLVDNFSTREHDLVLSEMAKVLSIPRDDFVRVWVATFSDRATGVFRTTEENIQYICQALGCPVIATNIGAAADIYHRYYEQKLTPRGGVLNVLAKLKTDGHKIGLISDCSSELPDVWPSTPFARLVDAAVFSCHVGVRKPDPKIYLFACQQLGVKPQDCLYIGDGSSRELTGAAAVGMQALLLRVPHEDTQDVRRIDMDAWTGPSISDLRHIVALARSGKKSKK